jgi:ribonuclease P/MRP protein subunit POP1
LTGARVLDTHIYKPGSYPFDLIAPIIILWKYPHVVSGADPAQGQTATTQGSSFQNKKKPKNMGKGEADTGHVSAAVSSVDVRTVWIRSHPAVFDEVFSALQTSASVTLDAIRQSSGATIAASTEIEIADLREHVNVFEIMGPKSNQVLKGALTPAEDKREEFKRVSR